MSSGAGGCAADVQHPGTALIAAVHRVSFREGTAPLFPLFGHLAWYSHLYPVTDRVSRKLRRSDSGWLPDFAVGWVPGSDR